MASMLVSGKEALQANSERHLTASWKESIVAAKCFSNTFAEGDLKSKNSGGREEKEKKTELVFNKIF